MLGEGAWLCPLMMVREFKQARVLEEEEVGVRFQHGAAGGRGGRGQVSETK